MLFILILVRLIKRGVDLPGLFLNFDVASTQPRVNTPSSFLYYIPAIYALW
ncbi:MAG: hypothetical protein U5K56_17505 [Halioglobus sp.]|nr:hypothetical protein [Halioglobus sp.]